MGSPEKPSGCSLQNLLQILRDWAWTDGKGWVAMGAAQAPSRDPQSWVQLAGLGSSCVKVGGGVPGQRVPERLRAEAARRPGQLQSTRGPPHAGAGQGAAVKGTSPPGSPGSVSRWWRVGTPSSGSGGGAWHAPGETAQAAYPSCHGGPRQRLSLASGDLGEQSPTGAGADKGVGAPLRV